MKVLFVTFAPFHQGPAGPTSDAASARYRVLLPGEQLARLGHHVRMATLPPGGELPAALVDNPCDVLVVSKSFNAISEVLATRLRARGARIVVDICDDHFDHPEFGPHFRRLVELADQVVASTGVMAKAIRQHTGRDCVIITDPVEGPRGTPRICPRLPALNLVWFGHPSNLSGLTTRADELKDLVERVQVRLTVITTPTEEVKSELVRFAGIAAPGARLGVELRPWSLEATWKAFAGADVVWIPVRPSEQKAVKSPNRLVEPVWSGRLVVADPVPSYTPFADLLPIGRDLVTSVLAALDAPAETERKIREAQRRIARDHSTYECGRRWAAVLGDATERPLRLNLGCGDKILPGYVNVDVVETRAGMKPDVICDLHDLAPFDDGCAEEVLSVHVVEHFWRWEVLDVLKEWARVLKPGGRMVIECPNLESACRAFLANPAQFSREDQNGQRTMWVFYGDPAWKDPLMVHRWGYTPDSLQALLAEAGLSDVRQEPAQFKLREPRDMRVVGIKR